MHTLTNSLQCSAFMCCIDILGEGLYSLRIGRHGRHLGDVKLHQHSKGFIMLTCLVLSPPRSQYFPVCLSCIYIRRAFIAPRHFEFTFIIDTYKEVKSIIKTSLNNKWKESHPEYNKQDGVYCLNIRGQTPIFRLRTGHNRLKYHIHKIFKVVETDLCSCGQAVETAQHVLQNCRLYSNATVRQSIWRERVDMHTKLYGPPPELEKAVAFIAQAGIGI